MVTALSWPSVLAWRVQRQGLEQRLPAAQWPAIVRRICGLHAQVRRSAELTLWARVDGLRAGCLDAALWSERTLVKTWAMRGTLHLLDAADLATYAGAQGAQAPRYDSASWRKAFGMSSAEAASVLDAIREALDDEPLTRDELADAVAQRLGDARLGEAVRGSFGTMPKLAAFRGDLCFAPSRGRYVCFTRPDRWLGEDWAAAAAVDALAEVIRRHLAVYGPASRETFARWFGMRSAAQAGRAIKALGEELAAVSVDGQEGWLLAGDVAAAAAAEPAGTVCLLPAFDHYVVAAPREDGPVIAAAYKDRVYRPQGWLSPVLLVDGRIEGVWRHELKRGQLTVQVEPFGDLGQAVRAGVEAQAQRLAQFFDAELDVGFGS